MPESRCDVILSIFQLSLSDRCNFNVCRLERVKLYEKRMDKSSALIFLVSAPVEI